MKLKILISLFLSFHALEAYEESPCFIVFLVKAPHLNTATISTFLKTAAKHPSDGCKNGDVGHAWIYLKGDDGVLEGGHSGELGELQPRYMEGVVDNIRLGAKNPVSYLWCEQVDGFFQHGNGGHKPTYAAFFSLTQDQYKAIWAYIKAYPFHQYSITGNQCCTFVHGIAEVIGIHLEDQVTLKIDQITTLYGRKCRMWEDSRYEYLSFSSPDRLEVSLKQLVKEGKAQNVLRLYKNN